MELKYEWGKGSVPTPVAYVNEFGSLVLQNVDGGGVVFDRDGDISCSFDFNPFEDGVKKIFYPGDEVTIKF